MSFISLQYWKGYLILDSQQAHNKHCDTANHLCLISFHIKHARPPATQAIA